MPKTRVLIVDDNPEFTTIVRHVMEQDNYATEVAHTGEQAVELYQAGDFDAVLLDLYLGPESGLDTLRRLRQCNADVPIIVMTAFGSMAAVTEALNEKAFDFLVKPFPAEEFRLLVRRATEHRRQSPTAAQLEEPEQPARAIIGKSAAMIEVFKAIVRVSKNDATVLITGESGTGKELVARAIHDHSPRAGKPFVAVNCGAFTETLLESELFGHVRGAFTGAVTTHRGLFESASGGTIFLDEITETSASLQVRLLRVLQERTIRPVGTSEERPVDVRILAATNRSMSDLLHARDFRKDLFSRLSVINISLPPLRERTEDIPLLVNHFLQKFGSQQGKKITIPDETLRWLVALPWAGNVRELENAMERAVTMNQDGQLLASDFTRFGFIHEAHVKAPPAGPPSAPPPSVPGTLEQVEREHILATLRFTRGNKLRAAELLGIGRWSLYRMAQRLGIDLNGARSDEKSPPKE